MFSTMLVVRGRPLELDAHLARLCDSARELYGASLPANVRRLAADTAREHALARLRLTLVPRGHDAPPQVDAVTRTIEAEIVLPGPARALALRACRVDGWRGAHKWTDRRLLDALDAGAAPASALLVDPAAHVLETTRANVFCVDAAGVLRTPPADGRILPGVARAVVIELAAAHDVEVCCAPLPLAGLASAREAFATGSVRGLEPIGELDGAALPGLGPVAAALAAALHSRWLGSFQKANPRQSSIE